MKNNKAPDEDRGDKEGKDMVSTAVAISCNKCLIEVIIIIHKKGKHLILLNSAICEKYSPTAKYTANILLYYNIFTYIQQQMWLSKVRLFK